jgi:hypothetical protein
MEPSGNIFVKPAALGLALIAKNELEKSERRFLSQGLRSET